jgi:Icc-related predicted phosphoesterase
MRIACVSDLHGYFPEIPDCDVLVLAGDYCPHTDGAVLWLNKRFAPWIENVSKRCRIVGIAGNHDFPFETDADKINPMEWTYLQDSGCQIDGVKFWGTPYTPRFFDWAFNADEPFLTETWAKIPDDTDVLITHGPPLGFGDFSDFGKEHCGSKSLLHRVMDIKPRLHVYGHIHPGFGRWEVNHEDMEDDGYWATTFANCSYVNNKYMPTNAPQIFDIL